MGRHRKRFITRDEHGEVLYRNEMQRDFRVGVKETQFEGTKDVWQGRHARPLIARVLSSVLLDSQLAILSCVYSLMEFAKEEVLLNKIINRLICKRVARAAFGKPSRSQHKNNGKIMPKHLHF